MSVSLVFLVTQASVLIYKTICTYSLNYYFDIEVASIITKLLYCMRSNIFNFYKSKYQYEIEKVSHIARKNHGLSTKTCYFINVHVVCPSEILT